MTSFEYQDLDADETELVGTWAPSGSGVHADETTRRIEWLVATRLQKISGGGWETLYRDPRDGRFWERTFRFDSAIADGCSVPASIEMRFEIA